MKTRICFILLFILSAQLGCSKFAFRSPQTNVNSLLEGGNGDGYEGVTAEMFYNWKNDLSCTDKRGNIIHSYDFKINYTKNNIKLSSDLCTNEKIDINNAVIERAEYNPGVLVFNSLIFQKEYIKTNIGDVLILCRDLESNESEGLDIVLRQWDFEYSDIYDTNFYQVDLRFNGEKYQNMQMYFPTSQGVRISKSLNFLQFNYVGADNSARPDLMNFKINLDQPVPGYSNRYYGEFTNNAIYSVRTMCIIEGNF